MESTSSGGILIPDLFDGYEIPKWSLTAVDPVNESASLLRFGAKLLSLSVFVPFLLRNGKASQEAKIGRLLEHLRETKPNSKIGFVGFCWGGRFALTMNSQFDATVACHPSRVTFPQELQEINKPISFAVAETDHHYGAETAAETEKILKAKGVEVVVVVYKGVQHGWAIRANMADTDKKVAREKAREQVMTWFERHLVV
ncbi:hypothetical protein EVJ58_g7103 [Rhodofomes roseus]|uniref:Dienelactone hydrolase domain-containing protein n=1 Tax=Rhodofomes roseus TaxID=34475 RepID=A0A4Y9Y484_9APHY|nr:hypothetical protein EVJ58_g7103 [Rhodofomes roseus]